VSGTSFATPVVSGLIGLVWSFFPQLEGNQVKQALLESCGITPHINGKIKYKNTGSTVLKIKKHIDQ
jgi:subtilisin family serine protease